MELTNTFQESFHVVVFQTSSGSNELAFIAFPFHMFNILINREQVGTQQLALPCFLQDIDSISQV